MKKLLTVALVLFLSLGIFAQKNQTKSVFRQVTEPLAQILSVEKQSQLQKLRKSENYLNVSIIQVGDIEKEVRSGKISFDFSNKIGKTTAIRRHLDYTESNNFVWNGELDSGGEVILVHENGRTFGQIRKDGRVFDIQYLENGYATLIEYNMEKLNQLGCATEENHAVVKTSKSNYKIDTSQNGSNAQAAAGGSSSTLIRVLALFTPAAEATGINLTDLANTARSQWLTAQINSSVQSNLQIVGVEELNLNETTDVTADVNTLRNNITAQQLRDQFEADIVILFTNGVGGDYNGVAGIVSQIGPDEDDAYGIVQVANATSTITWAHEVGHLFGARHQLSADNTPGDAHGHNWSTGWWLWKDEYRSVMRTNHSDMERVLHFSNPSRTHAGKATGVTGVSFNARVINVNGGIVCDFRFTQPDMSVSIYGTGMADDGELLSFTSGVSNGQSPISYSWQVDIGGGYYTAGTSSTFNYTMPTGKDLDVRLTVTGNDGQTATDYHPVMNSFLGGGPCTICPDSTAFDFSGSEETLDEQVLELEKPILYPNPSPDRIQLAFKEGLLQYDQLQIIDLSGSIRNEIRLQPQNKDTNQITIEISSLNQGTYIIKLLGKGAVSTFRFIKE